MIKMLSLRNVYRGIPATSRKLHSSAFVTQRKQSDVIKQQEEEGELPKEIVSGAPQSLVTERVVRIYKESKPASQSGLWGKGHRWENDLIGYQSSSDYMLFDTKEAAIKFAEGQGWTFYVQEPNERRFKKKDYSKNFLHSPTKLKHIRTK
ncbi:NADH dehydrogenase [ubiquinone] iron-sulfur protein 4, mitochondrial [Wickerhamomyces ciferrii]|uniref:NADH dehydrogenase [ubiquinone] iron-sulfur protein 4, mitochondrial n=1 Tax=Wickerhamomyces ciferrii (strain ATCC 14091 / BCRC 22168 / CBS 111 / JCM 3599 / NBRC 0793 / NRRL Y-1031 F-60-10) TaxID=1206466 RepID=K0KDF8_WICCF|nr:NADH dehydrogenase [ubiquinone] iron-sulfur protein 4, mitochondrial [Wickerhamomyces ciferrii]CCH40951.1 NADH dehydrogenase [ubiquinone] iron-sulfur protein 4, mitochondrial [Wickerhamomyces ciferrii]